MPYIKPEGREFLDDAVHTMIDAMVDGNHLTDEEFMSIAGEINYCVSSLIGKLMGKRPSYNKIAVITGVLENIKQEYYRRVASPYEDVKIRQNGDIKAYRSIQHE